MTYIYGHRGAMGEMPENTLPAFQRCLADGVNRCELDIQLSADGQLVVIHDQTLMRTTGRPGRVCDFTAAELEQLNACGRTPTPCRTPCPVPRLACLFEHCQFEHWQLEVKGTTASQAPQMVEALVHLLDQYQLQHQVTITSSSLTILRTLQALAPDLPRGLVAERAIPEPVVQAQRHDCQMLVLHWKLCTARRIEKAQEVGLQVSAWTVNEPDRMRELADRGVHSLITDYPALALSTLGKGSDTGSQAQPPKQQAASL